MKESLSQYGGIAAVLVLGIGFLAVGKAGPWLGVLFFIVLGMAIVLAPTASGKALFVAIGALICAGFLAWQAASNELSGTAIYRGVGRGSRVELVTRQLSPAKFREATNFLWAGSIVALFAGVVAFNLYRKLDDYTDDL